MILTFDSTGFRHVDETTWRHPALGDMIALKVMNWPLNEPYWLEDLPAMRRKLALDYGRVGCLIEAEPVVIGGVRAVCQVSKVPIPNAPSGQTFSANIFLAKASCYANFYFIAQETGITGMRETQIVFNLRSNPRDFYLPHPYAPEMKGVLPFHRGDDPAWDAQFPEHPLSRARAWVRLVLSTAVVDPAFAALPDFEPSRRSWA